jgi:outer membrane protein assembly factor BamB
VGAADGKTLWTRAFDSSSYRMHRRNSVATATPAVDAQRLYLSWATPDQLMVMALDHQGKTVWETGLGPYPSQHGYGVSPIRFEDLLIVPNEQDGGGSLVALEANSGKVRWQVPRHGKNATYSTPCIYQPANRPAELIFTNWQHGITAIDPRSGKPSWEISVFDTAKQERSIASPVVAGDLVLGTCGFVSAQKHFVAVRPDGNGKAKEVWRIEKAVSYLPTPLVKGDWIFLCSELGIASCVQAATGKVLWQERLGGTYSASPVCAGDHIYCVSDDGAVVVLAASDKFQVLARNTLGDATQSTPAIVNGRMIFRTESRLISLGGAK